MYYYIFEPAKNNTEINRQEDIKAILQKNQVAGEFVTLSLAEDPQDLTRIGLRRGYTTIVAVGSDSLINQIAAGLTGTDYGLGAVPTNPESDFLRMINAKDYQEACHCLPARRITRIDTISINGQQTLATKASVRRPGGQPELIKIDFDGFFQTEVRLSEIIISNIGVSNRKSKINQAYTDGLIDIFIPAKTQVRRSIFSFFTKLKKENRKKGSIFHPKKAKITSRKKVELAIDDKKIATTPLEIEAIPNSLNLIVKRRKAKSLEKYQK